MSSLRTQTIDLVQMLPDEELVTINSLLKMLIRSWDPDFAKVTPNEKAKLEKIEKDMNNGEFFSENDVWN